MAGLDISVDTGIPTSTILGVNITFEVITILSVLARLYVRLRVMKSPGWDDGMVVASVVTATLGTIFVSLSTKYGLGQHMSGLASDEFEKYISHFYVCNAAYNMSTALIKLSLLFQYLRVFEAGRTRILCIALIVIISIWGFIYSFMAWFPCFPIRAYWDWTITDARCYAYGTKTREPFVATFESHSAVNLLFDIIVFILPISIFWRKERTGREYAAILGLFLLGAMVILVSTWRLAAIVKHQAGWKPELDFTYYAATPILLACLELDIAVLAASMPIFWPIILKMVPSINVTKEVQITRERRWAASEVELDSASQNSKTELRQKERKRSKKGGFVVETVQPTPMETGSMNGDKETHMSDMSLDNRLSDIGHSRDRPGTERSSVPVPFSHNLDGRWEQSSV